MTPDVKLPSGALLIGEEWVADPSGGRMEHVNPSTGKVLASFALAGASEIETAVAAARDAFPAWRAWAPNARREVLFEIARRLEIHAPELSVLRSLEIGAPLKPGGGLNLAAEYFRYYAGWVDKLEGRTIPTYPGVALDYTLVEPYGVVAVLIPWNGPVVSAGMKVAPALAAGNTVVLKPSELGPLAALRFAELCRDAGLPPGVLNVVPGGPEAGQALVSHPGVDKISFTGGPATARKVLTAAAEHLVPVVLELGGKSANVVFADADLDAAVMTSVMAGIVNAAGQACVLPTRMLVADDVYDEVEARAADLARGVRVGDPFADGIQMGPVINDAACQRILGVIEQARDDGSGRLVAGGERLGGDLADGYFITPTVFGDVDHDSSLAQDEIFGPVLAMTRFADEDEAVALANGTRYGLGAIVYTNDLRRAHRVAARLDAGSLGINAFPPMPVNAPFGGMKESGFGREGGQAGVEEFLRVKNVYVSLS
jgi:aldehyde dehydrogenase (NAD+)